MEKKLVATLLATFMYATMFASIGVAEIDRELLDNDIDDVGIYNTPLINSIIKVKDEHIKSGRSLPDLDIVDLTITRVGDNYYEICYRLYNAGEADIVNADFTDKAWIYYEGSWVAIENSEINHIDFDLDEDEYSGWFCFYFYPTTGLHSFSLWTDIYNDVSEIIEDDDIPTNNKENRLWYWY